MVAWVVVWDRHVCRIWLWSQAVIRQVVLVPLTHAFLLLLEALPYPFSQRQRVFQHLVAELGPDPAPRRISLRLVLEQWLHFFLTENYRRMTDHETVPLEVELTCKLFPLFCTLMSMVPALAVPRLDALEEFPFRATIDT